MVRPAAVQHRRLTEVLAIDAPRGSPSPIRGKRLIVEWAVVASLATLVVALLAGSHATVRADNVVYDALSKLAQRAPSDDIVLVAIDNRSIEALGRWPWPRTRHAELLARLAAARPKAIAYDVLFIDPDPSPPVDLALAAAVRTAAPVLLPLTFDVPGDNGAPYHALYPAPPLRAAAAGIGQVNIEFDPDGVVRRALLAEGDGARVWPHMMELTYRAARGAPSAAYARGDHAGAPGAQGRGLLRSRPLLIPFTGPAGHYRTISFVDALRGETPEQFLRGKLVLVGATADGLGDRYATPLSGGTETMSGMEVQANLLDAMLSGRGIVALTSGPVVALSLAPLWLLMLGFLWLRPRANMILGAALMLATLAFSAILLLGARVWTPPSAALAGLLLVYPLWSWRRLQATSAYMLEELTRFAQEPELLPTSLGAASGDVVTREVDLMRATVERARDLRRFVSDALQGLPDATLVVDLQDKVVIANRAADLLFARLAGRRPDGAGLDELVAVFEREPSEVGEPGGLQNAELAAPDGGAFHMRRTALHDVREQTIGWIVRFADISALKAAGRQREQILQLLTHDMRSPQVSILALLQNAGDGAEPALAARIEGYARRTLALADDFVHLARAESAPLEMGVLDMADVLLDAVDDLWPQSQARRIAVTVETGEGGYLAAGDRSLLTRALINLVGNAIKYTEPGGRVDCRLEAVAGQVVCVVADTGRGMSADQLSHLFERFRRETPGGRGGADGVGLGLTFVQTVAERHGGKVVCDSRLGEGSTFTFSLPAAEEEE